MDHPGPTLTFGDGLDIHGKLVFPDNYELIVRSTLILVQGELQITAVKPVDGNPQVKFVMHGDKDEFFEPADSNSNICGDGLCEAGSRSITIAGGKLSLRGVPAETPTFMNLYDMDGDSTIILPDSVLEKWEQGARIVITSNTQAWWADQQRTIERISIAKPGFVNIELSSPITRPTTVKDDVGFSVEVALLSRNIMFESEDGGGHFWVMQTPLVQQLIEGVEIANFGQQGRLGRYPLHFHMCGDVRGSIIAKNTVRNSNQRCFVVHGTDNLRLEDNVAFDTKGHCYMLEDGIETGNEFVRNIGIRTGAPRTIIPDMGSNGIESDGLPATFWMTNPHNTWIDNVVAGSEHTGFWFELLKRGDRKVDFPNLDPKTDSIIKFDGFVAHSTSAVGFTYYLSGYEPTSLQLFDNMRFYRNHNKAIRIHRTRNVVVQNGIFMDNPINVEVDRSEEVHLLNTSIVGYSDGYKDTVGQGGYGFALAPCGNQKDELLGLTFQSTNPWIYKMESEFNGVIMDNVRFSGFSRSGCGSYSSIDLASRLDGFKTFEMFSSFTDVTIDNPDSIDFCSGASTNADDVYVSDVHGTLFGERGPSTLLRNSAILLHFVDESKCSDNNEKCYSYCEETCFRTVFYHVSQSQRNVYALKVCDRNSTSNCVEVSGTVSRPAWPTRFAVHVPNGRQYNAFFVDDNEKTVYPDGVQITFKDKLCPSAPDEVDISLLGSGGEIAPPIANPTTFPSRPPTLRPSPGGVESTTKLSTSAPEGAQLVPDPSLAEDRKVPSLSVGRSKWWKWFPGWSW
jgi:hypothetical protein